MLFANLQQVLTLKHMANLNLFQIELKILATQVLSKVFFKCKVAMPYYIKYKLCMLIKYIYMIFGSNFYFSDIKMELTKNILYGSKHNMV